MDVCYCSCTICPSKRRPFGLGIPSKICRPFFSPPPLFKGGGGVYLPKENTGSRQCIVDSAQHTLKHVCVRNTKESVAEISLCISPLNPAPCASFLHPTEPTLRIPCVPSEPGLYKESVQPKHDGGREAVSWFEHAFPLLLKSADPALRPISVIQRAGEVRGILLLVVCVDLTATVVAVALVTVTVTVAVAVVATVPLLLCCCCC
mmetsp:Transcript_29972/g.75362  ORF Transcript_29972/g.75362 Transcript_29972/m.75362 type:complete len:205 (-) Transcript_29972:24-638(-)